MNERQHAFDSELETQADVRVLDESVGLWLGARVESSPVALPPSLTDARSEKPSES